MLKIFITYRRADNPDAAGRIADRLKDRFGRSNVFFDVDNVPPGIDFRDYLHEQVSQCDVLLAVIGDKWLDVDPETNQPHIHSEDDFTHIELAAALKRDIPVVPVLVGNAEFPDKSKFPVALAELAFRNFVEARPGTGFQDALTRLIDKLGNNGDTDPEPPPPPPPPPPKWPKYVAALAILIGAGIGIYVLQVDPPLPPPPPQKDVWEVSLYNIDDVGVAYVNNEEVLRCKYNEYNCNQDISDKLVGDNNWVRITVENQNGGWTYGYKILRNRKEVWAGSCGTVTQTPCETNSSEAGRVFECSVMVPPKKELTAQNRFLERAGRTSGTSGDNPEECSKPPAETKSIAQ